MIDKEESTVIHTLHKQGHSIRAIYGQNNTKSQIERFELSDGSFMDAHTIDIIIQEVNAYAVDNGISLSNTQELYNNQNIMQIVSSGWQGA